MVSVGLCRKDRCSPKEQIISRGFFSINEVIFESIQMIQHSTCIAPRCTWYFGACASLPHQLPTFSVYTENRISWLPYFFILVTRVTLTCYPRYKMGKLGIVITTTTISPARCAILIIYF